MFTASLAESISMDQLTTVIAPAVVASGLTFDEDSLRFINPETGKTVLMFESSEDSDFLDSVYSEVDSPDDLKNLFTQLGLVLEFSEVLDYNLPGIEDAGADISEDEQEDLASALPAPLDTAPPVEPVIAPRAGSWVDRLATASAVAATAASRGRSRSH